MLADKNEESIIELQKLEEEHQELKIKLKEAHDEMKKLDDEELKYWDDLNELEVRLLTYQEELSSFHLQYEQANIQLEYLANTNVFLDAFRINHEGQFGTINGLRLGRLPNQHVKLC